MMVNFPLGIIAYLVLVGSVALCAVTMNGV